MEKIGIGLFFSILAMAAAAIVEMRRLDFSRHYKGNSVTLPISAFYLLPQFILVGIGKAFMYAGQLYFFITQLPKAMKAISTGLFLTTELMHLVFLEVPFWLQS